MDLILIPKGQGRMRSTLERGLAEKDLVVQTYRSPEEAVKLVVHRPVTVLVLSADLKMEQLMPLISLAGNQECPIPVVFLVPEKVSRDRRQLLEKTAFDLVMQPWESSRLVMAVRNARVFRQNQMEIVAREQELAILDEVGKTILSTLELKKVLHIILEKTKELVPSEAWSLLLVDEESEDLLFSAATGSRAGRLSDFKLKIGQGIAGWVAREGKPVIVQNVLEDSRFYRKIDEKIDFKTRSVLCVPLESRDRILGVLEVINKMGDGLFTDRDLEMVTKLAGFAAIAIDNARLYHQTRMMALTDELTKLYNARFFNQFLDGEIRRCQRYESRVSLVFLDLDYFKQINDKYGHLVGSQVLIETAQVLKEGLREVDVVARYGGDEFLVILPETNIEEAGQVAERIRQAVESHRFQEEQGLDIKLTASFGVSCYPDHAKSKDELIRRADRAMYRVKRMNRNGVWVADDMDDGGEALRQGPMQ
jgi:diguanylate cyclase (GGDEF)-like protein